MLGAVIGARSASRSPTTSGSRSPGTPARLRERLAGAAPLLRRTSGTSTSSIDVRDRRARSRAVGRFAAGTFERVVRRRHADRRHDRRRARRLRRWSARCRPASCATTRRCCSPASSACPATSSWRHERRRFPSRSSSGCRWRSRCSPRSCPRAWRRGWCCSARSRRSASLLGIALDFDTGAGGPAARHRRDLDLGARDPLQARRSTGSTVPAAARPALIFAAVIAVGRPQRLGAAEALLLPLRARGVGRARRVLAQDLALFVVFFDLMLIPFYFLTGQWGRATGSRRRPSS